MSMIVHLSLCLFLATFSGVSGFLSGPGLLHGKRFSASRHDSTFRATPSLRNARMQQKAGDEFATVIFVRHGESQTNKERRFVSWIDSALTEKGCLEANACGKALRDAGVQLDVVYTSWLKRAIKTAWISLEQLDMCHIPVHTRTDLNERFVGCLVGETMESAIEKFGAEQVRVWRTTPDIRPNNIADDSPFYPGNDAKYAELDPADLPRAESLLDVRERVGEFWEDEVLPSLRDGQRVAIFAHENTLRALFFHIDPNIPPSEILQFEVPRATPILYKFDSQLRPVILDGAFSPLSGRVLGPAPPAGADSSALLGAQELSMDAEAGFR